MAKFESPTAMMDALSAPVDELIAAVGEGVARAQQAMDAATLENLRAIYAEDDDAARMLRDIGYRPTWYQIPEASAELTMALTVSGEQSAHGSGGGRRGLKLMGAPVNAGYTNRYNFEMKASSTVRFRVVPVPPSVAVDELRVVPRLAGMRYGEALELLDRLAIEVETAGVERPDDDHWVSGTNPAAGESLAAGRLLLVNLTESDPNEV